MFCMFDHSANRFRISSQLRDFDREENLLHLLLRPLRPFGAHSRSPALPLSRSRFPSALPLSPTTIPEEAHEVFTQTVLKQAPARQQHHRTEDPGVWAASFESTP
jgi:hypothetical protein